MNYSLFYVQVLGKTLNLVILHCCFAGYFKEALKKCNREARSRLGLPEKKYKNMYLICFKCGPF